MRLINVVPESDICGRPSVPSRHRRVEAREIDYEGNVRVDRSGVKVKRPDNSRSVAGQGQPLEERWANAQTFFPLTSSHRTHRDTTENQKFTKSVRTIGLMKRLENISPSLRVATMPLRGCGP